MEPIGVHVGRSGGSAVRWQGEVGQPIPGGQGVDLDLWPGVVEEAIDEVSMAFGFEPFRLQGAVEENEAKEEKK